MLKCFDLTNKKNDKEETVIRFYKTNLNITNA